MNKVIITFLFLIGIVASSCTTSKSIVSQNADLSKYDIDYLTGRPIASWRGAYTTLGFSAAADFKGAIKRVAKQIAETFPK